MSIPLLHSALIPFASTAALSYFKGVALAHMLTRTRTISSFILAQKLGLVNLVPALPEQVAAWRVDGLLRYHGLIATELYLRQPQFFDAYSLSNDGDKEALIPGFLEVRNWERTQEVSTETFPENNLVFMASVSQMKTMLLFHGGRKEPTVENLLEALGDLPEEQKAASRLFLEKEFQNDGKS